MKHASSLPAGESPDPVDTPESLLASLGVECTLPDEPPAWITAPLTDAQRSVMAKAIMGAADNGIAGPESLALTLYKLALQPGLPSTAAPFLFYAAAELFAARLLEDERQLAADAGVLATEFSRRHEAGKLVLDAERELFGEVGGEGQSS